MPKGLNSNQVRSKTIEARDVEGRLNIVYWIRIAAGIIAGIASGLYHWALPQPMGSIAIVILVYILTIPVAITLFGNVRTPKKMYSHGIGGYVIWWFVAYSIYLSMIIRA